MATFGVFLIAFFLLVLGLLRLAYRETEQDFPILRRCRHHRALRH